MNRGGANEQLQDLISELHEVDSRIDNGKLRQIVAFGPRAIPHLESILVEALEKSSQIDLKTPYSNRDWFTVVHALYLLAEIRAEDSLGLVLEFLAQKQNVLDYWLHELLDDDVWEILFFLGQNRLDSLGALVLDQRINSFSRLSVGTALIQIGLHQPSKVASVVEIFKKVLKLPDEDPDFSGLLVSELLDFKNDALRADLIEALKKNKVWSGIISPDEVDWSYKNKQVRKLQPLNIFERYRLFRQYTNITAPSRSELTEKVKQYNLHNYI